MAAEVPHIKVTVEYKGDEADIYCAHFIDAISFLCHCEAMLRKGIHLKQPVDISTSEIQRHNLAELINKNK